MWVPLDVDNLGEKLVPLIETLLNKQQPSADGLKTLQLTSTESMTRAMHSIREAMRAAPNPGRPGAGTVHAMKYTRSEPDIINLSTVRSKLKFPSYATTPEMPTTGKISDILDSLFSTPPKTGVAYYVGEPLTHDADGFLHPGGNLLKLQKMPGVNSYYWHAGTKDSVTGPHKEDGNFLSVNLTMHGYKLWILVREADTVRFEELCRNLRYKNQRPCLQDRQGHETIDDDQWLRHLNILIHPRWLQKHGIRFDMFVAGPGQLVVTGRHQYHQVINLTDCFAISINFLPSCEPPLRDHTWTCRDCGLFHLEHEHIHRIPQRHTRCSKCGRFHLPPGTVQQATGQDTHDRQPGTQDGAGSAIRPSRAPERRRRQAQQQGRPAAKRRRLTAPAKGPQEIVPQHPSPSDSARTWSNFVRDQDPFSKHDNMMKTKGVLVHRIALAVRCSQAVRNLVQAVKGFRLEESSNRTMHKHFTTPPPNQSLQRIADLVRGCESKSQIWAVLCMITQIRCWRRISELIGSQINLTEHAWGLIARDLGRDALSRSERDTVRGYRNTGRRLGGGLKGLIILIPTTPLSPCRVELSDLSTLSDDDEQTLLERIGSDAYSKKLLEISDQLVNRLEDGRGIQKRKWEGQQDLLERAITDGRHEDVLNLVEPK